VAPWLPELRKLVLQLHLDGPSQLHSGRPRDRGAAPARIAHRAARRARPGGLDGTLDGVVARAAGRRYAREPGTAHRDAGRRLLLDREKLGGRRLRHSRQAKCRDPDDQASRSAHGGRSHLCNTLVRREEVPRRVNQRSAPRSPGPARPAGQPQPPSRIDALRGAPAPTLLLSGPSPVLAQADLEEQQKQCASESDRYQRDGEDLAGQSADHRRA
jgi:hypothetical protein